MRRSEGRGAWTPLSQCHSNRGACGLPTDILFRFFAFSLFLFFSFLPRVCFHSFLFSFPLCCFALAFSRVSIAVFKLSRSLALFCDAFLLSFRCSRFFSVFFSFALHALHSLLLVAAIFGCSLFPSPPAELGCSHDPAAVRAVEDHSACSSYFLCFFFLDEETRIMVGEAILSYSASDNTAIFNSLAALSPFSHSKQKLFENFLGLFEVAKHSKHKRQAQKIAAHRSCLIGSEVQEMCVVQVGFIVETPEEQEGCGHGSSSG
jgi:hypothetical protein